MADIINIAREAWASTRKLPAFDELIDSYRDELITRAKVVEQDRRVSNEGAEIFRQFEQTVLELLIPERFHPTNPAPVESVLAESEPAKKAKKNVGKKEK